MLTRNDHRYIGDNGELIDDATDKVIRTNFKKHHRTIRTTQDLLATLRAGASCWPGGYKLYFLTRDGQVLCFGCVRRNLYNVISSIRDNCNDGWRVEYLINSAEIDDDEYCVECSANLGNYS